MDYLHDEKGLKGATINRYLAAYSELFSTAVRKKAMSYVPKVKWYAENKGRPRFFTDTEVDDLEAFFLDSDHPWMADFVILGVNTGMRLGEILGINNRVPTPPGEQPKAYGYLSDCGGFIELHETKNGESRIVPLNEEAVGALANLNNKPSDFYTHRSFYDTWDAARMSIAPEDRDFVFHVLRHTCATRLVMEYQVDHITVGLILGHKSPLTTKKYVHPVKQSLAGVMAKMSKTHLKEIAA
jgi:integrase